MPTLAASSSGVPWVDLNYADSLFLGLVLKEIVELAGNPQEASGFTLPVFLMNLIKVFYLDRSATVLETEFDDLPRQSMIVGVNPVLLLLTVFICLCLGIKTLPRLSPSPN